MLLVLIKATDVCTLDSRIDMQGMGALSILLFMLVLTVAMSWGLFYLARR